MTDLRIIQAKDSDDLTVKPIIRSNSPQHLNRSSCVVVLGKAGDMKPGKTCGLVQAIERLQNYYNWEPPITVVNPHETKLEDQDT